LLPVSGSTPSPSRVVFTVMMPIDDVFSFSRFVDVNVTCVTDALAMEDAQCDKLATVFV